MEGRAAGQNRGLDAVQSLGFLVAVCVCAALSLVFAIGALRHAADSPRSYPRVQINPNNAPLSSLARLPRVGMARARAIVALRNQLKNEKGCETVFRCAEDLAQVKGIGPVTIEAIRPWLQFDTSAADGNDHSPK